jgi:cation diffusion facilitator CzcD-associated flavoprotein CzcO
MTDSNVIDRRDVVVVGGGQAGLAIGYFLTRQGRDFTTFFVARRCWAGSRMTRSISRTGSACSRAASRVARGFRLE